MSPRPWSANLDMYRRVPTDLLEGTKRGSILSVMAIVTMTVLFLLETKAFFGVRLAAEMTLDSNDDAQIRINFNITLMDMKCEYATIDIKSDLGTHQNITQNVNKWQIDAEGVRQRYMSRNMHQTDIAMSDPTVTQTIDQLHEDGVDAVDLDERTINYAKKTQEYLFVDFFASWCSHCRDLAPTWEVLAEVMDIAAEESLDKKIEGEAHKYSDEDYNEAKKVELPVMVGKVDCVNHVTVCQQEGIMAYPTLRMFVDGQKYADYNGHRTVIEMVHWLSAIETKHKSEKGTENKIDSTVHDIAHEFTLEEKPEEKEWAEKIKKHRHMFSATNNWNDGDHPGCQLSGFLNVDRSPGNFHIIARSKSKVFDPRVTNVSHEVHHLSFGMPRPADFAKKNAGEVPPHFVESTQAMNGNVYVTKNLHEAHHHYLKVITTNVDVPQAYSRYNNKQFTAAYQILPSSQLSLFPEDTVPEAKFAYDLSPIAISYKKTYMNWYDYVTKLMAIVGGTFTIVGLLESGIHAATSKKNR